MNIFIVTVLGKSLRRHQFTSIRSFVKFMDANANYELFDAHCHLHYNCNRSFVVINELTNIKFAIMCTRPRDWPLMTSLYERLPSRIQPAIGVHPWFAHELDDDQWISDMHAELVRNRNLIVGEIGLDKLWVPPDRERNEIERQLVVFNKQLDLATELQRPVSLHSVKCDGIMFDLLSKRTELPPKIYFHAFGGTVATARSYYRMKRFGSRFYFGFASAINLRSMKTTEVIASIPDDRLLLESDLEDPNDVAGSLYKMIEVIATSKAWDIPTACRITTENAKCFYSFL